MKLDRLYFDWPYFDIALGAYPSIDLPRLNVSNKAEAKRFLAAYGYDIEKDHIREEIWRIYFQALNFLQSQLLEGDERIPEKYLKRSPSCEIVRLLMDASRKNKDRESSRDASWACAFLRVMHVISHLENDVRLEHFQYAREQIFNRFDDVVKQTGKRKWAVGEGNDSVTVIRYIKKERKDRNSILTKLLAKRFSIAEEIYDRLGLRFVTESRLDAFRLLQKFFELGAISSVNVNATRGTNGLIPIDRLRQEVESAKRELEEGRISVNVAKKRLQKLEEEFSNSLDFVSRNPNSSPWYKAIQITCRQLITAPDPTFKFWTDVRNELEKKPATRAALKHIPIMVREEKSFYYPFEVQIMDKESYVESIGGRSRHREYKARQKLMARNRVLRDLV